jgi:hypothetical protein
MLSVSSAIGLLQGLTITSIAGPREKARGEDNMIIFFETLLAINLISQTGKKDIHKGDEGRKDITRKTYMEFWQEVAQQNHVKSMRL